ncbi:MAG TPA: sirohydrochlorin chelatase [Bacillales bacterium]|nr:sirohydrochlorin chelatase [Bacillales bacterium]
MQAVLFVGHGSRVEAGRLQAADFIRKCLDEIDVPIREFCFLELAEPSIEEGIARCVEQGATRIAVLPLLLLTAGHAKKDIPAKLREIGRHYPHLTIDYGASLGVHNAIIDILFERIYEQAPIADDASVLIVGRGSSDPGIKTDFANIVRLFKKRHSFRRVRTAYLAAAEPRFEEGLEEMRATDSSQIFVVPYLLFTGVLMTEMGQKITELNADEGESQFVLCHSLGYHPNLKQVVLERVAETIQSTGADSDGFLSIDGGYRK